MSRRARNRPDKRAVAEDLARERVRRHEDEPDVYVTTDGRRIDLRKPWPFPSNLTEKGKTT